MGGCGGWGGGRGLHREIYGCFFCVCVSRLVVATVFQTVNGKPYVFRLKEQHNQEGGVNSTARAYPMIFAIVTSRPVKRGILLGFENGAGDVVGC